MKIIKMAYKSDIEITQVKELKDIKAIAKKIKIYENDLVLYGEYKVKLFLLLIDEEKIKQNNLMGVRCSRFCFTNG